jgi:hypothetical protein
MFIRYLAHQREAPIESSRAVAALVPCPLQISVGVCLALWSASCNTLRLETTENSLMESRSPRRWCHRLAIHGCMLQCIN